MPPTSLRRHGHRNSHGWLSTGNGSADEHYQALTEAKHVVHKVLLGYAYDLPGWKALVDWTKVEFERPPE